MKSFEFSHWDLSDTNKGLLFFAQSLEELLFHFGHDSLKVPALNFRFLCIEILTTIEKIDEEIIDKGNMRPLFEELRNSYEHDPIAKCLFGDEFLSLFFFLKTQKVKLIGIVLKFIRIQVRIYLLSR